MFDIGWSELLVVGVVALIVVGPKDLPAMFHTLGRFTAKAKSMAREFQRAMDDAAKESGVGDVAKDLKNITSAKSMGLDKVQQAATKFENWDPMKKAPGSTAPKGPATQALSEERQEIKRKVEEATAKRATERLAAEAAAKAEAAAPAAKSAPAAGRPATKPAKAAPKQAAKTAPKASPKAAAKTAVKPAATSKAKPAARKTKS